jgi:ATP-dependent Zn protease
LQSATGSIERVTRTNHGIAEDAALPDALQAEVSATVARLAEKAKTIVEQNRHSIERVAVALAKGAPLDQAAIDRLIENQDG